MPKLICCETIKYNVSIQLYPYIYFSIGRHAPTLKLVPPLKLRRHADSASVRHRFRIACASAKATATRGQRSKACRRRSADKAQIKSQIYVWRPWKVLAAEALHIY